MKHFDGFWRNSKQFSAISRYSAKFPDPKPRLFLLVNWSLFVLRISIFLDFEIFPDFEDLYKKSWSETSNFPSCKLITFCTQNFNFPGFWTFFPNRSFTSKGSSGGQRGGFQKHLIRWAHGVVRTSRGEVAVQISGKFSKSGKMEPTEEENDQFTRRKIRGFGLEILKNDPKLLQNNPNCFKMLQNASKCFKMLQNASKML